jgi:hypothetical protein
MPLQQLLAGAHAHRANGATGQSLAATQQAFILRQVSFLHEQEFNDGTLVGTSVTGQVDRG